MFSTFLNKLHFYQLYFNMAFTVLQAPLGSLSEKHRELPSHPCLHLWLHIPPVLCSSLTSLLHYKPHSLQANVSLSCLNNHRCIRIVDIFSFLPCAPPHTFNKVFFLKMLHCYLFGKFFYSLCAFLLLNIIKNSNNFKLFFTPTSAVAERLKAAAS